MAALERYYLAQGAEVAGYDRTSTDLTRALESEGVRISFVDEVDAAIPPSFRDPAEVTVVYTPAVPESTAVMTFFRQGGFRMIKRAQLLGEITRSSKGLCFAGTHGKTTTSSMAAHLLHQSGCGCNAFLGGVLRNYGSNFLLAPDSPWSVIEADEFDRSFHHLTPYIAVITATDPDHLDIYGTEEAYLESFAHFTELVRPGGALIIHEGLKLKPRPAEGVMVYSYSRDSGDFHAANIRRGEGTIEFDFVYPGGSITDLCLGAPVEVNIENAVAALAACHLTGELTPETARSAMASFMGPQRRFEQRWREADRPGRKGRVIIDDYAHHPDELRASISSVKSLYPSRELTVAFQPHLYTRTRDFAEGFAEALDLADRVVLLDIYPAREEPIEGVTSKIIFDRMQNKNKQLISRKELTNTIKNSNFDVLLTAGAGDIVDLIPEVIDAVRADS